MATVWIVYITHTKAEVETEAFQTAHSTANAVL